VLAPQGAGIFRLKPILQPDQPQSMQSCIDSGTKMGRLVLLLVEHLGRGAQWMSDAPAAYGRSVLVSGSRTFRCLRIISAFGAMPSHFAAVS
jgi:hypothetical protein